MKEYNKDMLPTTTRADTIIVCPVCGDRVLERCYACGKPLNKRNTKIWCRERGKMSHICYDCGSQTAAGVEYIKEHNISKRKR